MARAMQGEEVGHAQKVRTAERDRRSLYRHLKGGEGCRVCNLPLIGWRWGYRWCSKNLSLWHSGSSQRVLSLKLPSYTWVGLLVPVELRDVCQLHPHQEEPTAHPEAVLWFLSAFPHSNNCLNQRRSWRLKPFSYKQETSGRKERNVGGKERPLHLGRGPQGSTQFQFLLFFDTPLSWWSKVLNRAITHKLGWGTWFQGNSVLLQRLFI